MSMHSAKYLRNLLGAALGAALLMFAGCSDKPTPAPPPPEVEHITVKSQPIPKVVYLPGRVQDTRTDEVRSWAYGILKLMLYIEVRNVRVGPALFSIVPWEFRALLNALYALHEHTKHT